MPIKQEGQEQDEVPTVSDEHERVRDVAFAVSADGDTDIIYHNGPILPTIVPLAIDISRRDSKHANVLVVLETFGGDPNSAYRFARILQQSYQKFVLLIPNDCKSAGTLIATGAHELIIADRGELGPLDIQLGKKDEPWELQSSLVIMDTVNSLGILAKDTFDQIHMSLKGWSGHSITLKTATDIATRITTGLFQPIYGQIDPLQIGESGRAMRVGRAYAMRLAREAQNIVQDNVERLSTGYPSHDFVIDRVEAEALFESVRAPTTTEEELIASLTRFSEQYVPAKLIGMIDEEAESGLSIDPDNQQPEGLNHGE